MARKGKRPLAQAPGAGLTRGVFLGGVLRPAIKHYVHPEVTGLENLADQSPPLILAANHSSHMDTPLILNSMPKELRRKTLVAAASDYFFSSRARGFFVSVAIGAVPMDRRVVSKQAMDEVDQLLADKWCLVIYPEGSRTLDGRLYRGKTGIARLALSAKAPIVPVGIAGTYDSMPAGRSWPTSGHVQVRFGKPLTFDRYRLGVADQLVLRAITDQVMYEIMMLSGQTYVDEYVTSAKVRQSRADSEADAKPAGGAGPALPDEADDTPDDEPDGDESTSLHSHSSRHICITEIDEFKVSCRLTNHVVVTTTSSGARRCDNHVVAARPAGAPPARPAPRPPGPHRARAGHLDLPSRAR